MEIDIEKLSEKECANLIIKLNEKLKILKAKRAEELLHKKKYKEYLTWCYNATMNMIEGYKNIRFITRSFNAYHDDDNTLTISVPEILPELDEYRYKLFMTIKNNDWSDIEE